MNEHPVEIAAAAVGGKGKLARAVGVTPQAISKWLISRIPAERVLSVEKATGVSRRILRSDIYPTEKLRA